MDFVEFEQRARAIWEEIPPEYQEGVDGLDVRRAAKAHPSLPEVYTLGECQSEFYPSEFGGAGEVRSIVVLYYGSFLALSRREPEWNWEDELWETITHEVRHHLESLATEDALEQQDYAEDQNFARREGEGFDPLFYRFGNRIGERTYEVDGDCFVEHPIEASRFGRDELRVPWNGREWRVPWPSRLGDVHFVSLRGVIEEPSELLLVLSRRRRIWEQVRGMLRKAPLEILHTEVEAEPVG